MGVDNIEGTGGDDTIVVPNVNAQGATATTAQSFDSVDGGAGTDTLKWYATATENTAISPAISNVEIARFYGAENISVAAGAGTVDASLIGGAQQVWLHTAGRAVNVNGLSGKTFGIDGKTTGLATGNFGTGTTAALALNSASDAAGTGNATVDIAGVATSLSVSGAGKATLTDNAAGVDTLKSLTVGATGATTLDVFGLGALTSIDASASTAAVTLAAGIAATVASLKTGAGDDSFTVTATSKATVDSGAGNDTVTLGAVLAAGSTINLGAGNDKLLGTSLPAVSSLTTIDGGDGIDTVSAALINNGNAAQFKNFEVVGLEGATTLDLALMTGSTITGLELVSGGGTYSNATLGQSLAVTNDATASATSIAFTGATGGSDAYSINFAASTTGTAGTPTTIDAGTLTLAGVETFNIDSSAAKGVNANALTLTAAQAQNVVITGDQAFTLDFAGTNGTIVSGVGGVSTINASAATGKVDIDVANVTAATAGLTVSGGSAADVLTTSTFSTTLTGNGGNDSFEVAATVGGAAGAISAAAAAKTTITDFAVGDSIALIDVFGTTTFNTTKVNVGAATTLDDAADLAAATSVGAGDATVNWFQYGGNTYVVQDVSATTSLDGSDVLVKLTGVVDLSTASVSVTDVLTLA